MLGYKPTPKSKVKLTFDECKRIRKKIKEEKVDEKKDDKRKTCEHLTLTKDGIYIVCTLCGEVLKEDPLFCAKRMSFEEGTRKDGIFVICNGNNRIRSYYSFIEDKFIYQKKEKIPTLPELKSTAKEKGIRGFSTMRKNELIEEINNPKE